MRSHFDVIVWRFSIDPRNCKKRREFITLLGGAAGWPLVTRAQQPALPVIGYLHPQSPEAYVEPMRAFRQGLKDEGCVEGENVAIEYRWADNQYDRLPMLAAELVRRRVVVIATPGGLLAALAAKAATITVPIVFNVGDDPVRHGLVASLARPGGNKTGVNFFAFELGEKRLELLHELVPAATRVAVLLNPASGVNTEVTLRDVETVARRFKLEIQILHADTDRDIDAASQASDENGQMPCSSRLLHSSSRDVFNWSSCRHSIEFLRRMGCAIMQR